MSTAELIVLAPVAAGGKREAQQEEETPEGAGTRVHALDTPLFARFIQLDATEDGA